MVYSDFKQNSSLICDTYINYGGNNIYTVDKIKDDEVIKVIIDPDTGEIIGYLGLGDKIVRKKSIDAMKEKYAEFEPIDTRKFTKLYHNEFRKVTEMRLNKELSVTAELLFRTLGDYLDFSGDNIVKYKGMALGTKTIGNQLLGYSKNQTIKLLNELIDLNLIAKVKRGRNVLYIMNPEYYNRGKVLKSTKTIFRIKTDDIEWDRDFLGIGSNK